MSFMQLGRLNAHKQNNTNTLDLTPDSGKMFG